MNLIPSPRAFRARLVAVLPETADYLLIATGFSDSELGRYRVLVSEAKGE